jgi:hypothetical protein
MILQEIIDALNLTVLTNAKDFKSIVPSTGYTSDLLSCVMSGAAQGGIWVTLQSHANIVAVAALLDLSAVIITENAQPEPAVISRANDEGITLLLSKDRSFRVVGRLWEMGLRGE